MCKYYFMIILIYFSGLIAEETATDTTKSNKENRYINEINNKKDKINDRDETINKIIIDTPYDIKGML